MNRLWTIVLATCLLLGASAAADAGVLGRHLGLGWSDGYHADCNCNGCGHGLFHRMFCSDPCWHDRTCVKTKVVSPGCFGCSDHIAPGYKTGPVYHP